MTVYNDVRSTIKPDEISIDDYSVWVCSNIQDISHENEEAGGLIPEFSFDMVQYDKDEYILKTNEDITDLLVQIASVEVEAGNLELESINEAFQGAVKVKIEDGKRLDL